MNESPMRNTDTLDRVLYGLLLSAVFMLPFSLEPPKAVLLVATAAIYVVRRLAIRDFKLPASPLNLPFACYIVVNVVSVILSPEPLFSLDGFRGEPLKIGILYLASLDAVRSELRLRGLVYTILSASAVLGLVGIPGWLMDIGVLVQKTPDNLLRAVSMNGSYTYLALYLIIGIALAVAVRPHLGNTQAQKAWQRGALDLAMLGAIGCVVLTFTRGAWVALALAIVLLAFLLRRKGPIVLMGAFIVFFLLFSGAAFERLMSILDVRSYAKVAIPDRLPNWAVAASMIRDRPLIGMGCGQSIMAEVYRRDPRYQDQPGLPANYKPLPDAHNEYLQIMLETGIAGLFTLIWFFALFVRHGWPRVKPSDYTFRDSAFVGLFAAIVALWVYGLVGHFWNDEVSQTLTVLMVSLGMMNDE